MNAKLLILTGVAVTFIASAFAGEEGKKAKDRPSPEEMAARIIVNNDVDDDSALNPEELERFLVKMQERRKERMAKMRERHGDGEGKGPRAGGPRGEERKRPEPGEVAQNWIAEFDFDESGTLDGAELIEAMGSMRDKGPRGKMGPRGQGGPPPQDAESDE